MLWQSRTYLHSRNRLSRILPAWAAACVLPLALLSAGCGADSFAGGATAHTPTTGGSSFASDGLGPIVVLHNPAPGMLDISLAVTFDQSVGDTQQMVEIGLGFESHGVSVQFAGDERVTCDGVDLPLKGRVAVFQVVREPAAKLIGTTVRCDYTAGGPIASVTLQIPTPPTITSPQPGARVARSAHTLVTYRSDPATSTLLGIVALVVPPPSPNKASAQMNTPGPLQATVDTSAFAAGSGSLVLTASLTPRITASGVPFASVSAIGSVNSPVTVTWV